MTVDKKQLESQLTGQVFTPEDEQYARYIKRWSSNAERRAAFIAVVKSPEDIAKTILWATENNLDLAIRGGAHSVSGASSTENGLVVDLSELREVRIDSGMQLAYAQGGATWEDFDKATTAAGFVGVGGTVNHTGIGGLILGGGYGYLTGQYGLAIDNLVEATMVVADGRIVKTSKEENPDLFWGIRGGGCNFGVVYEFVLKVHPHQGSCFGGVLALSPDKIPEVVNAYEKYWRLQNPKTSFLLGVSANPSTLQTALLCNLFYDTDDEKLGRATFNDFYEMEPLEDHTEMHPYVVQNAILNPFLQHGPRSYVKGFAFSVLSIELLQYTVNKFKELVAYLGEDYAPGAMLFENYPQAKMNEIAPDATAFANRGTHSNCFVVIRWKSSENDAWVAKWVNEFIAGARVIDAPIAMKVGKTNLDGRGYANTLMDDDKVEAAFRENLPRLKELKKKWDPHCRFNKWFAISA